jgi:hypothetical protein
VVVAEGESAPVFHIVAAGSVLLQERGPHTPSPPPAEEAQVAEAAGMLTTRALQTLAVHAQPQHHVVDGWGVFGRRCVTRGPGATPPPPAVALRRAVVLSLPRDAMLELGSGHHPLATVRARVAAAASAGLGCVAPLLCLPPPQRCVQCGVEPRACTSELLRRSRAITRPCGRRPPGWDFSAKDPQIIRHFFDGACCTAPTPSTALRITHHSTPAGRRTRWRSW